MEKIILTIGPDEQGPGLSWSIIEVRDDGEAEPYDSDGVDGDDLPLDTNGWEIRAQYEVALPSPVEGAGLDWSDAVVAPFGWSWGAGHAPAGVTMTWTIPASDGDDDGDDDGEVSTSPAVLAWRAGIAARDRRLADADARAEDAPVHFPDFADFED